MAKWNTITNPGRWNNLVQPGKWNTLGFIYTIYVTSARTAYYRNGVDYYHVQWTFYFSQPVPSNVSFTIRCGSYYEVTCLAGNSSCTLDIDILLTDYPVWHPTNYAGFPSGYVNSDTMPAETYTPPFYIEVSSAIYSVTQYTYFVSIIYEFTASAPVPIPEVFGVAWYDEYNAQQNYTSNEAYEGSSNWYYSQLLYKYDSSTWTYSPSYITTPIVSGSGSVGYYYSDSMDSYLVPSIF